MGEMGGDAVLVPASTPRQRTETPPERAPASGTPSTRSDCLLSYPRARATSRPRPHDRCPRPRTRGSPRFPRPRAPSACARRGLPTRGRTAAADRDLPALPQLSRAGLRLAAEGRHRHVGRRLLGAPGPDVAVVHNGQLTNFHDWRRRLQRSGHRFQSECDSEIIAVYLAQRMTEGLSLRRRCAAACTDLDGVFTYICVTEDALGVAKDEAGAKPRCCTRTTTWSALASEEIAIRQVLDREIEPHDPYEGTVRVWTR